MFIILVVVSYLILMYTSIATPEGSPAPSLLNSVGPSLLPPALGGANRAMYLGRGVLVPIVPSLLWRGAV